MSAASHLPKIAGTISAGTLVAALISVPAVREFLTKYTPSPLRGNMWKIALAAIALANFKNLPGIWHVRVLRGILYQLYLQPTPQPPKHLFSAMITKSRNTFYDCDYNLHKSNSTYFADLDVARAHTVGCLIRTGLTRLNRGDEEGLPEEVRKAKGSYYVALGAVSCFFQRQIEPLQAFEIHTRVLSWDRKWLYLVSHIVKKGAVKPECYVLQPWKKGKALKPGEVRVKDEELRKHIFATSVARYCFKKGRLTINPEIVLERSRLLPKRPEGIRLPPRGESEIATPASTVATPAADGGESNPETVVAKASEELGEFVESVGKEGEEADEAWTWDDMEKERLRGLTTASHFDRLSAAHNELKGGEVLGENAMLG